MLLVYGLQTCSVLGEVVAVIQDEYKPQTRDSLQLDPSTKEQSLPQPLLISDDCFPLSWEMYL